MAELVIKGLPPPKPGISIAKKIVAAHKAEEKAGPKVGITGHPIFHKGMKFEAKPTAEQPLVECKLKRDCEHKGLRAGINILPLDVAHSLISFM